MSQTLHYRFPRPQQVPQHKSLSKEAQISKDLEISERYTKPEIVISLEPYIKNYKSSHSSVQKAINIPIDDPIDDLYQQSRKQLQEYKVQLPYPKNVSIQSQPKSASESMKRSRSVSEQSSFKQPDIKAKVSLERTLTKNRESSTTPKKARSNSPFITRDTAKTNLDDTFDKSSGDPLACHADNIVRMAMDTTMLGSFYNSSISSNFSNLLDESFMSKREGHDSILEGSRKPNVLSLSKATKIEISAEDLENAIKDPLRLG